MGTFDVSSCGSSMSRTGGEGTRREVRCRGGREVQRRGEKTQRRAREERIQKTGHRKIRSVATVPNAGGNCESYRREDGEGLEW